MERLTVHTASYRPLPLPVRRLPSPEPKRRHVAYETVTVHRDTYQPVDTSKPVKSIIPRDHRFLDGDGQGRFYCTSHRADYPAKVGQPGKY